MHVETCIDKLHIRESEKGFNCVMVCVHGLNDNGYDNGNGEELRTSVAIGSDVSSWKKENRQKLFSLVSSHVFFFASHMYNSF